MRGQKGDKMKRQKEKSLKISDFSYFLVIPLGFKPKTFRTGNKR